MVFRALPWCVCSLSRICLIEALSGNEVLSYLDCPIGRRKAFSHAAAEGRGVRELKRPDPKASAEIAAMVAAVFDNIEAISKG